MIDIIIYCNVCYFMFAFKSFKHHDIQQLNRLLFNAVKSFIVGTSCPVLTRKNYHRILVATVKFLLCIIELIDRSCQGLIRSIFMMVTKVQSCDWQRDQKIGWSIDWQFSEDLCTFINWCFESPHKFSVTCQGTKYLNSIGSDIKLKIAYFFACNKIIIILLLFHTFIGSIKKLMPPFCPLWESLLQLSQQARLLLFTAACRPG